MDPVQYAQQMNRFGGIKNRHLRIQTRKRRILDRVQNEPQRLEIDGKPLRQFQKENDVFQFMKVKWKFVIDAASDW